MTGAICDGFMEGTNISKYCPSCKKITNCRMAAYYDLGKCLECGKVFKMVIK